jgi:hypothetical protein
VLISKISSRISSAGLFLLILFTALCCYLWVSPASPHNSYLIAEILHTYGAETKVSSLYENYAELLPVFIPIWQAEAFSVASWLINISRAAATAIILMALFNLQLGRVVAVSFSLSWMLITIISITSGNFGAAALSELLMASLVYGFSLAFKGAASRKQTLTRALVILIPFLFLLYGSGLAVAWFPLALMYLVGVFKSISPRFDVIISAGILLFSSLIVLCLTGHLSAGLSLFSNPLEANAFVFALKTICLVLPLPAIIAVFYPILALRFGVSRVLGFSLTLIIHIFLLVCLPDRQPGSIDIGINFVTIQSLSLLILYLLAGWFKESGLNNFSIIRTFLAIIIILPPLIALANMNDGDSLKNLSHSAKTESDILLASLPDSSIFIATNERTAKSLNYAQTLLGKRIDLSVVENLTLESLQSGRPLYSYLDLDLPHSYQLYSAGIAWQVINNGVVVPQWEIVSNFLRVCSLYKIYFPNFIDISASLGLADIFKAPVVQLFGKEYSSEELDFIKDVIAGNNVDEANLQELCLRLAHSYKMQELPELPLHSYIRMK